MKKIFPNYFGNFKNIEYAKCCIICWYFCFLFTFASSNNCVPLVALVSSSITLRFYQNWYTIISKCFRTVIASFCNKISATRICSILHDHSIKVEERKLNVSVLFSELLKPNIKGDTTIWKDLVHFAKYLDFAGPQVFWKLISNDHSYISAHDAKMKLCS